MVDLDIAVSAKNAIFKELYCLDILFDGPFATRSETIEKIKIRSKNIIEKCNVIIETVSTMEAH